VGGPVDVLDDLPRLDQETGAGRGERDVPGGAVDEQHADCPFKALHLGAERGRDDVLAGGGPAEVQLLGESDEVPQLAQFDTGATGGIGGNSPECRVAGQGTHGETSSMTPLVRIDIHLAVLSLTFP
jgi:hypothetical protein